MELPIYQIDAFTTETFGGNPAAVVPLDTWLGDDVLLKIAAENNQSETAFFIPTKDGFFIRWFTPTMEVDLCGHATLATSWVIFNKLGYSKDQIHYQTNESGDVIVKRSTQGITLDFPIWTSEKSDVIDPIIEQAFGRAPLEIHKGKKWVCVYDDPDFIRHVAPNIDLINSVDCQGIVITSKCDDTEFDFISRNFAPQSGIPEDPVTGVAHCILTPIWAKKLNKTSFKARQVSARGGNLDIELDGDRVFLTGEATLYMQGTIYI
jgi:PhzF family phenazine biosynthesis protein